MYKESLKLNPELPQGWGALGDAYSMLDKPFDAVDAYTCATKYEPGNRILASKLQLAHRRARGVRLQGISPGTSQQHEVRLYVYELETDS